MQRNDRMIGVSNHRRPRATALCITKVTNIFPNIHARIFIKTVNLAVTALVAPLRTVDTNHFAPTLWVAGDVNSFLERGTRTPHLQVTVLDRKMRGIRKQDQRIIQIDVLFDDASSFCLHHAPAGPSRRAASAAAAPLRVELVVGICRGVSAPDAVLVGHDVSFIPDEPSGTERGASDQKPCHGPRALVHVRVGSCIVTFRPLGIVLSAQRLACIRCASSCARRVFINVKDTSGKRAHEHVLVARHSTYCSISVNVRSPESVRVTASAVPAQARHDVGLAPLAI